MTWTVVYSTVLFVLLATVWVHRALPAIRIRDVPLMVTGILFLHVYLVIICSVYVINGRFPCGLEYWVMSLWFPLGIGFFQLQNAQLLIKSIEQNDLLYGQILYKKIGRGPDRFWQRFKYMWSNFNRQQRYAFCIGIAMAIQVSSKLASLSDWKAWVDGSINFRSWSRSSSFWHLVDSILPLGAWVN